MGWAHLGFWVCLLTFGLICLVIVERFINYQRRSRLDAESRRKYVEGRHRSEYEIAFDEMALKVLVWCFLFVCLFGHLAGSPLEDTLHIFFE